jgi:hypothetical protein
LRKSCLTSGNNKPNTIKGTAKRASSTALGLADVDGADHHLNSQSALLNRRS